MSKSGDRPYRRLVETKENVKADRVLAYTGKNREVWREILALPRVTIGNDVVTSMEEEPVTFDDVVARFQVASPEGDAEDLAIKVPEGVPDISKEKYEELVHYFKYASSCYVLLCPRPCGNVLVTTFSNAVTDIQGFVARDPTRKELVVALRGSASLADAILDTQILLVPLIAPGVKAASGVRVHSGFLTAWDSVALQVLTVVEVEKKLYPDYAIVTTGHSLGGSIALLAALTLKGAFPSTEVRTYSYGSPRVGNEAFAEFVNNLFGLSAHRAVHGNDGVPTMIPSRLGYHHHGVEYWQHSKPPSNSTTVQCDMSGEDPRCSVSVPSRGITLAHTNYFGILVSTPFCL
ncbi:hypothetical protein NMY22_g6327 [Coprinellus aureogranulatus]|nr:hypothetical protein NMY22_g6327 [Coprinellus aureogranulatus]